jgi:hypothetical protein
MREAPFARDFRDAIRLPVDGSRKGLIGIGMGVLTMDLKGWATCGRVETMKRRRLATKVEGKARRVRFRETSVRSDEITEWSCAIRARVLEIDTRREERSSPGRAKNSDAEETGIAVGEMPARGQEMSTQPLEIATTTKGIETSSKEIETLTGEMTASVRGIATAFKEIATSSKEIASPGKEIETSAKEIATRRREMGILL